MKIMIMTDMEGAAGILNFEDWVFPSGRYYENGKSLLTAEVNAAVDGFFAAGASEVLVVDGHGCGGINPELLDERAMLMSGAPRPAWPWGLDRSFSGLAFVGQHAKAGTPFSHMTHTQDFQYVDLSLNGVSIGEYGQLALCAMELGVPTVLACGEKALAEEASALTPGVVTVSVKHGLLPDGLGDVDAQTYGRSKLSAVHISPRRARGMIRAGAVEAMRRLREDPSAFRYPDIRPPYVLQGVLRPSGSNPKRKFRNEHPTSVIAVMNMPARCEPVRPLKSGRRG